MHRKINYIAVLTTFTAASMLQAATHRSPQLDAAKKVQLQPATLNLQMLPETATEAAEMPGMKWKTGKTDWFNVHYERKTFAMKVARQVNYLHEYIAIDFGLQDKKDTPSEIFIFRDEKKWGKFVNHIGGNQWMASFVQGDCMYLQEYKDTQDSMKLLSHETTHLVINRYYSTGRIPIWLNEGLAEWYGEFGYAAYKGRKASRKAAFKHLDDAYPLKELFAMKTYPADQNGDVARFYKTSKCIVGFLRTKWGDELFAKYIQSVFKGAAPIKAIYATFPPNNIEELQDVFTKFTN